MKTRKVSQRSAGKRGQGLTDKVRGLLVIAVSGLTLLVVGCQPSAKEPSSAEAPSAESGRSPLEVVNLRMQAYNEHDLDAILSTYSEGVEIFTYPDKSLGKGKKRLESLFEDLFQEDSRRVDIRHQIAKDSYVINHETVLSGDKETEYVSIYEVRGGLIRSVRFVRD